eukprot:m.123828 g.123828  ORF g.123828 m.123828 type:complete len:449 (+) comp22031_c0_seq1:83-1429(+)
MNNMAACDILVFSQPHARKHTRARCQCARLHRGSSPLDRGAWAQGLSQIERHDGVGKRPPPLVRPELHPRPLRCSEWLRHHGVPRGRAHACVGRFRAGHKSLEGCVPHHLGEVRPWAGDCEERGEVEREVLLELRPPPRVDLRLRPGCWWLVVWIVWRERGQPVAWGAHIRIKPDDGSWPGVERHDLAAVGDQSSLLQRRKVGCGNVHVQSARLVVHLLEDAKMLVLNPARGVEGPQIHGVGWVDGSPGHAIGNHEPSVGRVEDAVQSTCHLVLAGRQCREPRRRHVGPGHGHDPVGEHAVNHVKCANRVGRDGQPKLDRLFVCKVQPFGCDDVAVVVLEPPLWVGFKRDHRWVGRGVARKLIHVVVEQDLDRWLDRLETGCHLSDTTDCCHVETNRAEREHHDFVCLGNECQLRVSEESTTHGTIPPPRICRSVPTVCPSGRGPRHG